MELPVILPAPAEELNGKTIRFRVRSTRGDPPQDRIADGQGTLMIDFAYEIEGMFVATIDVTVWPVTPTGTVQIHTIPLDQRSVDCIRILPNPEEGVELECVDPSLPNGLFVYP